MQLLEAAGVLQLADFASDPELVGSVGGLDIDRCV
jgi:hypothetical protein